MIFTKKIKREKHTHKKRKIQDAQQNVFKSGKNM